MHDIDRTQLEDDTEFGDELDVETFADEAFDETDTFEMDEIESPFSEAEEMELASELLEITDEYELDQFLGNVFRRIGRGVKKLARSPLGRALGGVLRGVARRALPALAAAGGSMLGGPVGGALAGRLGAMAAKRLGLELEGLSPEEQEFEIARQFVRLAGSAARRAARMPTSMAPHAAARAAVTAAARRYAPGLLRTHRSGTGFYGYGVGGRSGRWIRRGKRIILFGA